MELPEIYRNITMKITKVMGASKNGIYTAKDEQLALLAKALAHPARIAILNLLTKRQACICGDIVDEIPLSQSTISQHLKELKTAGLIKGEIDGAKVCYCIDERVWEEAKKLFAAYFESYQSISCC